MQRGGPVASGPQLTAFAAPWRRLCFGYQPGPGLPGQACTRIWPCPSLSLHRGDPEPSPAPHSGAVLLLAPPPGSLGMPCCYSRAAARPVSGR